MARAFGIVTSSGTHIKVDGMQQYRPIGAFSFLGRYRVIDFPISNMSNSGIDHIQVYVRNKPRFWLSTSEPDVIITSTPNAANFSLCSHRTVLKTTYTTQISLLSMKTSNSSSVCMSHM